MTALPSLDAVNAASLVLPVAVGPVIMIISQGESTMILKIIKRVHDNAFLLIFAGLKL